jgi:hypothetical protein
MMLLLLLFASIPPSGYMISEATRFVAIFDTGDAEEIAQTKLEFDEWYEAAWRHRIAYRIVTEARDRQNACYRR